MVETEEVADLYMTYGAPNLETNSFRKANSFAFTEGILVNLSEKYSLNGYAIYTKSRGASDSKDKAPDYGKANVVQ